MKIYLRRALRYMLSLLITFVVLFTLMDLISGDLSFESLRSRGWTLAAIIVVLGATYPSFGFVKRTLKADIQADRETIVKAFEQNGYKLSGETQGALTFRAVSALKRFSTMWEDAVTVTPDDNYIILDGIRKEVVKVEFRLKSLLQ